MRLFYALISITCIMMLLFGCAQKRETILTVETSFPRDTIVYDTIVVDTTLDTTIYSGTKDSLVSDTVVTIAPKSNSVNWIIITTSIRYDTTYKFWKIVEYLTIKKEIHEKLIRDTITIINNDMDDMDTVSDTVLMNVDTLFKQFIKYIHPGKDSILDTIIHTPDTVIDTHFVDTYLFATTADTLTGNLGFVIIDWTFSDTIVTGGLDLLSIGVDSRLFTYDNLVYIIDGSSGSIICFDGPVITDQPLYNEYIDSSAGLHDISFISNSIAYLTRYNRDELLVIDPSNGVVIKPIDLAPYGMYAGTDSSEVPFMQCSKIYNNNLYVLCQRLKMGKGGVPEVGHLSGLIVVISTLTDSVDTTISLKKKYPVSMDVNGGYLYVASLGAASDTIPGGIEKIDLSSNTNVGSVLNEPGIYNDISGIVMVDNTKGYLLIETKFRGEIKVFEFNPPDLGEEVTSIQNAAGGMAYDGKYLYVGDRGTTNPGVVIIDHTDNSRVAGPIKMGLNAPKSVSVLTVSK